MGNTTLIRFVALGAIGFGAGAAIITFGGVLIPFAGALGGASLGLALQERRKTASLAFPGSRRIYLSLIAHSGSARGGAIGGASSFFTYASLPLGAIFGVVVGAAVGVAFRNLRRIAVLAVAGGVGFGVGLAVGFFIRDSLPMVGGMSLIVAGVIGGALLGAVLGYLESYGPIQERRLPVG